MPYSKEHACSDCGTLFGAQTPNRLRCDACRDKHRLTSRRTTLDPISCVVCGVDFQPYRRGAKTCSPECRRAHTKLSRRVEPVQHVEKLLQYYNSKGPVVIDKVAEGSTVLVISDFQYPFVDTGWLDAVERMIEDARPDIIFYNGDILDTYGLSKFRHNPDRQFRLQDEVELTKDMLRRHARLSNGAVQYWADGNHEERVQAWIWEQGTRDSSFLMKDLPEVLDLDNLTESYVSYSNHFDFLGFVITHGPRRVSQFSGYTARKVLERFRSSGAIGHTHRAGSYSMTDGKGVSHTVYEIGCTCRLDLEYAHHTENWQHAFLIGEVHDGALHPQLIREIHGKRGDGFVVNGQFYRVKR